MTSFSLDKFFKFCFIFSLSTSSNILFSNVPSNILSIPSIESLTPFILSLSSLFACSYSALDELNEIFSIALFINVEKYASALE